MKPNAEPLAEILRRLNPRQEKVVRLYFGLGCKRSHSVAEMAEEFTVAPAVIHRILSAAKKRLVEAGVTSQELRDASRGIIRRRINSHGHRTS